MTFLQAYAILDVMCDKSGTGYFTPAEKKILLQQGTYMWLKSLSKQFEKDLEVVDGMYTVVNGPQAISYNSTTKIGVLPQDFLYRLNCYYTAPQNRIRYVSWNNWNTVHDDPHNTPNSENPVYTMATTGMLFSGVPGTPQVFLVYIKKPTFSATDNTGEWVNLPEPEQYDVIAFSYELATNSMSDNRFSFALEMLRQNKT